MKKGVRILLVVIIMLAAGTAALKWYTDAERTQATAASAAGDENRVLATEVTAGNVRVTVEGPGAVVPVRTQSVRAGTNGVLTRAPEVGDLVARGAILAAVDPADLIKAVRQAELGLSQAELSLERAREAVSQADVDLGSAERLEQSGAATRDQVSQARTSLQNARFTVRAAELSVEQSQLALETAQDNLEGANVVAPFSGVVLEVSGSAGDLVSPGASLFVLADLSRVRVDAEIDEYDIGKISVGQRVTVSGDALGDESRDGRVERISPAAQVVNNIPIFTVSTVVENSDGRLRPGMNMDLQIMITSDRGIVVPSKAISTVRDRAYLDVVVDGIVETRRVTIGANDGLNTAVLEGLEAGELVVLPETATLTLTSGSAPPAGTSIIPINVPGSGGSR